MPQNVHSTSRTAAILTGFTTPASARKTPTSPPTPAATFGSTSAVTAASRRSSADAVTTRASTCWPRGAAITDVSLTATPQSSEPIPDTCDLQVKTWTLPVTGGNSQAMAKSYAQYCPLARALDLVGERWSLLVVKKLVHGPLRYSDLQERLGCPTNILAARLKSFEQEGLVARRRLPPPPASAVYETTGYG